jgi:hypothetical protein
MVLGQLREASWLLTHLETAPNLLTIVALGGMLSQ